MSWTPVVGHHPRVAEQSQTSQVVEALENMIFQRDFGFDSQ
jgi:hypothetical protein